MTVELVFPVFGDALLTDHSYSLYAALSGVVSQFHDVNVPLRFAPITGVAAPEGRLQLNDRSCLKVRLPNDAIRTTLPLAGKKLLIGDASVQLGMPTVRTLIPAPMLIARLVTIKNADTPEQMLAAARVQLAERGIVGDPQLPIHVEGERAGEPKRRVVRVKGIAITGYALIVAELSAEDSLKLQEVGLGGRTRLGCGFFMPVREGT